MNDFLVGAPLFCMLSIGVILFIWGVVGICALFAPILSSQISRDQNEQDEEWSGENDG